MNRRSILAVAGSSLSLGLSGCTAFGSTSQKAVDVVLHNETAATRKTTISVVDLNDNSSQIDTTLELEANERHQFNNNVRSNSKYRVEVGFETPEVDSNTYSETYKWSSVNQTLHVLLTDQVIFAKEVA